MTILLRSLHSPAQEGTSCPKSEMIRIRNEDVQVYDSIVS